MPLWNESTSILPLDAFFKPKHACAVGPEVLKSWSLEMDYSRAPCLGADQKTRGLWERDCPELHEDDESSLRRSAVRGNFTSGRRPLGSSSSVFKVPIIRDVWTL